MAVRAYNSNARLMGLAYVQALLTRHCFGCMNQDPGHDTYDTYKHRSMQQPARAGMEIASHLHMEPSDGPPQSHKKLFRQLHELAVGSIQQALHPSLKSFHRDHPDRYALVRSGSDPLAPIIVQCASLCNSMSKELDHNRAKGRRARVKLCSLFFDMGCHGSTEGR